MSVADGDGTAGSLRLSKHNGQGNDFLVLVDLDGRAQLTAGAVRTLCDRHRGVGADGVVRAVSWRDDGLYSRPYEVVAAMELFNADGSRAEMSGNGIRCLGQALWECGAISGDVALIATDAGVRRLTLSGLPRPGVATVSTTMGDVRLGDDLDVQGLHWLDPEDRRGIARACLADVGNPHLVLHVSDSRRVDIDRIGSAAQGAFVGGVNVEAVSPLERGSQVILDMVVYERGVGSTLACGTGSCAAAAVFRSWGSVGDDVEVVNPGGPLRVHFDGAEATLQGEVQHVADVVVDARILGAAETDDGTKPA